jgi:hypothetical protein
LSWQSFRDRLSWFSSDVEPVIIAGASALLVRTKLDRNSAASGKHKFRLENLINQPLDVTLSSELTPAQATVAYGMATRGTAAGKKWTYDRPLDQRGKAKAIRGDEAELTGPLDELSEILIAVSCRERGQASPVWPGQGKLTC